MNLGDRLKLFAEEMGGVKVLTEKINEITAKNTSLYKYIIGDSMPGYSLLFPLCLLGCNINWLFTGKGSMYINPTKDTGNPYLDIDNKLRKESKIESKKEKSNEYDLEKEFEKIRKQMEELQERVSRSERQSEESARAVRKGSPKYDPAVFDDELMLKSKKRPVK